MFLQLSNTDDCIMVMFGKFITPVIPEDLKQRSDKNETVDKSIDCRLDVF